MSRPTSAFHLPSLGKALVLLLGCGLSCAEEGQVPTCAHPADFLDEGQELDEQWQGSPQFRRWRTAMETAGCLTPLGGTPLGGMGGTRD